MICFAHIILILNSDNELSSIYKKMKLLEFILVTLQDENLYANSLTSAQQLKNKLYTNKTSMNLCPQKRVNITVDVP